MVDDESILARSFSSPVVVSLELSVISSTTTIPLYVTLEPSPVLSNTSLSSVLCASANWKMILLGEGDER